jgi:hypothetical protein
MTKTIRYTILKTELNPLDGYILLDASTHEADQENFYKVIQETVGGVFDVTVSPDRRHSIYCHDEGLLIGLPMNPYAHAMWGYGLAGTLVVTGPVDEVGYDTDVDPDLENEARVRCAAFINQMRVDAGMAPLV